MRYILDQLRNPIRARAAVLAVLTLLGITVPGLAGIETNDALVGGIMALMAIVLGWDNATKDTSQSTKNGDDTRHE